MEVSEHWTAADVGEVTDVLNAASPDDRFTADHLRQAVFDDPDGNPDLLLCRRADGKMVAVAAAVVRRPFMEGAERSGMIKLLAVHPDWQRRGIGGKLLGEVEDALRSLGVKSVGVFGDAPSHLRPGVDFRLTSLVCLLLRRGYEPRGTAVNMEAVLTGASFETAEDERRLIGADVEIRRLARRDADAFSAYLLAQWQWGWQTETMRALRRDPVSCFVATVHGEFVGFAAYDVSGPEAFGPMGVRPDLRRYGIGGVLLKRCLADMRDKGYRAADIQWVGPIPFYHRQVGATLSRCFFQMRKSLV